MDSIQTPELKPSVKSPIRPFWRFGMIGCATFICLMILALASLPYFINNVPYFRDLAQCQINIQSVGDALNRYAIKNDRYPDKLRDLVPDYIPAKVLRCPADKSADAISYIYFKRSINDADSAILLQCMQHRFNSNTPVAILSYTKSGQVIHNTGDDPALK